ncbi:MAG: hypothetical protein SPI59_07000 [Finegoldia sp.]|nr:hypothetical protein [Finegoldia sp.]
MGSLVSIYPIKILIYVFLSLLIAFLGSGLLTKALEETSISGTLTRLGEARLM